MTSIWMDPKQWMNRKDQYGYYTDASD